MPGNSLRALTRPARKNKCTGAPTLAINSGQHTPVPVQISQGHTPGTTGGQGHRVVYERCTLHGLSAIVLPPRHLPKGEGGGYKQNTRAHQAHTLAVHKIIRRCKGNTPGHPSSLHKRRPCRHPNPAARACAPDANTAQGCKGGRGVAQCVGHGGGGKKGQVSGARSRRDKKRASVPSFRWCMQHHGQSYSCQQLGAGGLGGGGNATHFATLGTQAQPRPQHVHPRVRLRKGIERPQGC